MSTENIENLVSSNEHYASSFDQGHLKSPPAKKYAIITCMDARMDTNPAFGISLGDAHIIRNAGGNAKDALRSLVISQHLLGTREVILIKHTKCGMLTFQNSDAMKVVKENSGEEAEKWLGSDFDFQPFGDLEGGVKEDVEYLKGSPALIKGTKVSGWVYEVESGKVKQVV